MTTTASVGSNRENALGLELPSTTGLWRSLYLEPVVGTGERLCIGCITYFNNATKHHRFISGSLLDAMYGAKADHVNGIIENALEIATMLAEQVSIRGDITPFVNITAGEAECVHTRSESELVRAAMLMSSSLATLSEPAQLNAEDVAETGTSINRQFITRVRDTVAVLRPELAIYFNRTATLKSTRSPVKFGYLSDSLVAHLSVLSPTRISNQVRNARGLMAEIDLAQRARGQGRAGLILGMPSLNSAVLSDRDRDALSSASEELRLECADYGVEYRTAETDEQTAQVLLALA